MRDAIAMREAQACGLVVATLVALECDLSFVGLAERAGGTGDNECLGALEVVWG